MQPTAPPLQFQILDGAHSGGNPHFFFLPPLVPAATFSGTSDGTRAPVVKVCDWSGTTCVARIAEFSMTSGTAAQVIRFDAKNQLYVVNWPTGQCVSGPCTLDPAKTYRLRVLIGVAELGHVDIKVVKTASGLKTINTTQYIGVLQGSTLAVKFRIEQGAVVIVAPGTPTPVGTSGGTVTSADGEVGLIIPPTALSTSTPITVAPSTGTVDPGVLAGSVYDLEPSGTTFATPVTLTIQYDPSKIPAGLHESSLKLYENSGTGWQRVPGSGPSLTDHTVSGGISHFSDAAPGMPVGAVTVSPATAEVTVGATVQLTATTTDSGGNVLTDRPVTWASADPSVATVDQTGLVSGVSGGPVTITAMSEGQSGTAAVSVPGALVASVSVIPATATVQVGDTLRLTTLVEDASGNILTGRRVVWATSSPPVATVSASGFVTAVTAGTATITATSEGKSGTAALVVVATVVTSLADDGSPGTLRQVLATAPSASTITFADNLCPAGTSCTISLTGELGIGSSLAIQGPGGYQLVLDGQQAHRVVRISGATVQVANVTITGGYVPANYGGGGANGGGIFIDGGSNLTLTHITVSGNSADSLGGGILNEGTLTLSNSTVSGNTVTCLVGCVANGVGSGIWAMGTVDLGNGSSVCNNTPLPNILVYGGTVSGTNNCPDP